MNRLERLDTKGVAVVTRGANNKRIALWKGRSMTLEEMLTKAMLEGDLGADDASIEEACKQAGLDPQMTETVKAMMKLRNVYKDVEAFGAMVGKLFGAKPAGDGKPPPSESEEPGAGKPPPGNEEDEQEEADMAMTDEEKKAQAETLEKAAKAEELVKKQAEQIEAQKAQIETQKTALDANTQAVKKMQDDLRMSQWVTKAEKHLAFITGKTAQELGEQLFKLDTFDKAAAEAQFELLKAQSKVVEASGMFRPSGASGGDGGQGGSGLAYDEIEKLASEIVTKSQSTEPREVAMARARLAVAKSRPELWIRYADEEQKQTNKALFKREMAD